KECVSSINRKVMARAYWIWQQLCQIGLSLTSVKTFQLSPSEFSRIELQGYEPYGSIRLRQLQTETEAIKGYSNDLKKYT
ncbi:hypothetical protein A2U01_0040420, partial [Trifolium medium]|nr:hypothetical protein [Trifolium medium]